MLDSCECKHPPLVKDVIQVIWLLFQQHRFTSPLFSRWLYDSVFAQLLIQGGPADVQHPGGSRPVVSGLFKRPEQQLFLFLLLREAGRFLLP